MGIVMGWGCGPMGTYRTGEHGRKVIIILWKYLNYLTRAILIKRYIYKVRCSNSHLWRHERGKLVWKLQ